MDILFLGIVLFGYAFFLIRPARTQKGKDNLAILAIGAGTILTMLPLVAVGFEIYHSTIYYGVPPIYYLSILIPYLLLTIPGVALLVHGLFMQKKPKRISSEQI
jgi:hypothetical protein